MPSTPQSGIERARWKPGQQRGFTMVELLTVVAIISVLATIAIPSLKVMIKNGRLRGASSDLYSDLLAARSQATANDVPVNVIPTGGVWTNGWTITYTPAHAGSVLTTLVQHEALSSDIAVKVIGTAGNVVYNSNGRISSASQTVVFYAPGVTNVEARCVSIDPSGLPRIALDTDGNYANGCN